MAQAITVNLPENTIRLAQETAEQSGRSFESVLADWIERGSAQDAILSTITNTPHHLYTPLGGEDTAQALWDYLQAQSSKSDI